jgi:hypothetical protein
MYANKLDMKINAGQKITMALDSPAAALSMLATRATRSKLPSALRCVGANESGPWSINSFSATRRATNSALWTWTFCGHVAFQVRLCDVLGC